jgi:hypothetical protein
MGESRRAHRVLVGKPEGRKQLGRRRYRWEDSIKMNLNEVGWETWIGVIWLRRGMGAGSFQ